MATGGIFTIITNDGKQDRMLMATALLHERLRSINAFKQGANGGAADALQNLPTLLDIEKTHVLFTNAHFKPFAAIGFEYNKVSPTGAAALGKTGVQFSIPQFGDFFHDMCGHAVLTQPTLTSTATTDSNAPLMRWCAFPGEALFQQVQMEVNGNPLDSYTFHATNMFREYRVAPNKILGWNRCMGQEEPQQGWVDQPNWALSGVTAAGVTTRMVSNVSKGAQTPTGQKDQAAAGNLELFIPLLFWFNKDVRLAIPSVAIPYGQRYINVNIASLAKLCNVYPRGAGTWDVPLGTVTDTGGASLSKLELYINNIFVNPEVHKIYIKRIGFSLIRVHRQQTYSCNTASGEILLQSLKWPIEYLFVGMKVTSYFDVDSATARNLDKWNTFSVVTDETSTTVGQQVLQKSVLVQSGITVSVASTTGALTLGTGGLAQALVAGDTVQIAGCFFSVLTGAAAAATTGAVLAPPPAATFTGTSANSFVVDLLGLQSTTRNFANTVDTVGIRAHGISIYDKYATKFYNAYTSYHYGGPNLNTPTDTGLVFIPFCLYPGTYQPSGHINVSRAREFYLDYTSSVVSTGTPCTLVVIASAINFLLISDGSAVLRYST